MYRRPHHRRIVELLQGLDGDLLAECECWFAGGTAVALQLDEYRRSDDIDFLCASTAGYRRLRERVLQLGIAGLCRKAVPVLREVRADQYGIRAVLGNIEAPVKFEIVREARIDLGPGPVRIAGTTVLRREDQFAEKLLANADRGLDRSTSHRDFIDLCMMVAHWGPIPPSAAAKAREAYGSGIDVSIGKVAVLLRAPGRLAECLLALDATPESEGQVLPLLSADRLFG